MKYELTKETKNVGCIILYRIKALRDFDVVKAGDLGGWVESESNLSQDDTCWVSGDAWVYGEAKVSGEARVFGDAWVYGKARVFGEAWVSGKAMVYENAVVSGKARVYGEAIISYTGDYLVVGPAKSSGRFTTAFKSKSGVTIMCGCFIGNIDEFQKAIEETHKNNPVYLKQYMAFVALIKENYDIMD